jgi:ATP-binding cassette subfamily B protein
VRRLGVLGRIIVSTWRADPWRATACSFLVLVLYASPAMGAVGVRLLVEAAARGSSVRAGVALLIGTIAVNQAAGFSAFTLRTSLRERVSHALDVEIMRLTAGRIGIDHLERPAHLDRVGILTEATGDLATLTESFLNAVGVALRLVTTIGLLATVDARLGLLTVCAVPSLAAGFVTDRIRDRRDNARAPLQRRSFLLNGLVRTAGPAAEIRTTGVGPTLQQRIHDDRVSIDRIIAGSNVTMTLVETAGWAVFGGGFAAALLLVAARARAGDVTVGQTAMVVTLGAQLNGHLGALASWLTDLLATLRTAGHLTWLIDACRDAEPGCAAPEVPGPMSLTHVDFTYPDTEEAVLRDVTLTLPPGTVVAVVGENGSGKTTLVKLLTRMYEPTAGRVEVAGTPLAEVDARSWRSCVAAVFQDAAPLELTARQVIGLGDLARMADDHALACAATAAGADGLIARLLAGLDTPLGRSFDDGMQLSGGEWQRLALARANLRRDPRLLVLDEPSANLDPAAEHALFERLVAAAHRQSGGGVTVFITHRLSTAARADHIVVLHEGRLVEQGTHRDLLAAGGQYADLYNLQADGYR